VDAVRVLQKQHAIILGHLTWQDKVMTELKQALSGVSNNANRRDPIPPRVAENQTTQRVDNNTPGVKLAPKGLGGADPVSTTRTTRSRIKFYGF